MRNLVEKRPIMVTPKCRDSNFNLSEFIQVPSFGCFKDERKRAYQNRKPAFKKFGALADKMGGTTAIGFGNLEGL